jgi:hypothetical protein
MRADELIRHLISGELANYRVVRTSPEPLHLSLNPLAWGYRILLSLLVVPFKVSCVSVT